ncbi:unnamed protein product [Ostreobium quekettii]|uniref:Dynein heavy chain tail domain-containing protein n=1 Tax=Ostreobium quekettii TaxID=121088 RepID=A0A8S1J9P8_9CHLO|nr:unnamed protein product [Ostreobium quekettii]|eukprot:evm.model.scf_2990.1 EVM.evm.TU.scf_2990.1   scf_2990:1100-4440(-)
MQRESEKQPVGRGPMAEIEFWRRRNAVLSSLCEQLHLGKVRAVVAAVEAGSSDKNLLSSFTTQVGELNKLTVEATDNVKFLTTLERHFKNIHAGRLAGILDTLPPMMNALRMVWIISRHYSDDVRMGNLFQRIAWEVADRAERAIDLKRLFKMPPQEAVDIIKTACSVLEHWYLVYMQVREKIEMSGRDARWEFPKNLLFQKTNYMADICRDLAEMVEVVDDFFKFLGPELKAVTGDTQGIDRVIQSVHAMVEPIENLPFNVFDQANNEQWLKVKTQVANDNEGIKKATRCVDMP